MPNSQTEGRPPGDALTGPVFVEGAAPGDTLVVEVLAIEQDGPGERGRAPFPAFALMALWAAGFQLLGPYRGVVDDEVTGWSVSAVSDRGDGHFEVRN